MEFLTGKDYDYLCDGCRAVIDQMASMLTESGEDTDNEEAPCDYVYDNRMFCGGHECVNKP